MDEQKTVGEMMPNPKDIEENKAIAAIGYISILCLVPLLMKKDSPYAQFHGKQGMVLFIASIILMVANVVPILGQLIWVVGSIIIIILMVIGIMNAVSGKTEELPVIGTYAKMIKL